MATTTEENKAITRRFVEEYWNQGNAALADQFIAADYVRTELFAPDKMDRLSSMEHFAATPED